MGGDYDLDINKPLKLPLNDEQKELLRDPWAVFTYEEEFYILYDDMAAMAGGRDRLLNSPIARALTPRKEQVATLEAAVKGGLLAEWFAEQTNNVIVPEGKLVPGEEDLDPDKLQWARSIKDEIGSDAVLKSIWVFRFEQLLTEAYRSMPHQLARITAEVYKSPESYTANHLEIAHIDAEINAHKATVIETVEDEWVPLWEAGEADATVMADLDRALTEYGENNAEVLKDLFRRKHEASERLADRIEKDNPGIGVEVEKDKGRQNLIEVLKKVAKDQGIPVSVIGGEEDCGDPDCPVHGAVAKQVLQPHSASAPKQLPAAKAAAAINEPVRSTESEGRITTMAPPNVKKKEDELKFSNVTVQFVDNPDSKAVVLPEGMTLKEGRYWLQKIEDEETRTFQYQYQFKGWYPLDAMWAAYRALAELHGFVHIGDFKNWWGTSPPSMITIQIDYGKDQQMPWGPIECNSFSAPLVPSIELVEGQPTLQFAALIRNNERGKVDALMKRAEEMLKTSSIYRGRAIDVDFEVIHPADFRFDPTKAPKFWNTRDTKLEELVLSASVERLVRTSVWTPIRKTAEARQHKIPLRRTTLLAGSYGVGKTLAAKATAKIAEDNGWTFIYLRKLSQLKEALYFAKKYQPAVIFAEDINRITSGKRGAEMDELFNVIDGIDRKNDEVMLVFTTNDVEEIHPGMIRPGRIDTIITIHPPDADATARLIKLYGRGLIDPNADLTRSSNKLAGQIPAIIREAVERAKIAALEDSDGGQMVVSEEHLDIAADQMLNHAEFLKEPPAAVPDMVALGNAIGNVVNNGLYHKLDQKTPPENVLAAGKKRLHDVLEETGVQGKNGHAATTASAK